MFYLCFPLVHVFEDDLKKIETCGSNSGVYVKVCFKYLCICWYYLLNNSNNWFKLSVLPSGPIYLYAVFIDVFKTVVVCGSISILLLFPLDYSLSNI